jgi:hypothetical protein
MLSSRDPNLTQTGTNGVTSPALSSRAATQRDPHAQTRSPSQSHENSFS